jgi:hypothetical protein
MLRAGVEFIRAGVAYKHLLETLKNHRARSPFAGHLLPNKRSSGRVCDRSPVADQPGGIPRRGPNLRNLGCRSEG